MTKNHMKQVAKILGVELGEEFQIVNGCGEIVCSYSNNDVFKLSYDGLYSIVKSSNRFELYSQNYFFLTHLLSGRYDVKKVQVNG